MTEMASLEVQENPLRSGLGSQGGGCANTALCTLKKDLTGVGEVVKTLKRKEKSRQMN